jgi:nucleotide-binding universal stress UspA family protein
MSPLSVLCPVDFSEASRSALVYAAEIADHLRAPLTVLSVDDPLLAEAAASAGLVPSLAEETARELRRLCTATLGEGPTRIAVRVRTGKPAVEILREARESAAQLIVMSSRGQTGVRKLFFGSTTERVLRETSVHVLVTPPTPPPGSSLPDIARHVGRVLAPVDLAAASSRQISLAGRIAQALSVPLLIAHVIEPMAIPVRVPLAIARIDAYRRERAEARLQEMAVSVGGREATETLVVSGDPADEIAKLAATRHANLIVMGLHSSEPFGPRMGSVTYRVLASTQELVLAVPPAVNGAAQ